MYVELYLIESNLGERVYMENNTYQESLNDYEEIDLRELLLDIWNNKYLICIITFVCILISAVYNFFIAAPVYESSSEIYTTDFRMINGSTLKHNEYISFFNTLKVKSKLIERYNLDTSLDRIGKKLTVTTNDDRYNTILTLRDTDNILAADLLNDWIKLFTDEVEAHINHVNLNYINNLEEMLVEREAFYLEAKKALTEFNKNTNLDLFKSRLSRDNSKLVDMENRVLVLKNELSVLTEKKKLLDEQLDRTDKFIVTNETLDDSSMKILLDLLEGNSLAQSLIIKKENINSIYISLQNQLNQTELELTKITEELQLTTNDIDNLSTVLVTLKAEIALLEDEKDLLNLRVSEAKKNYQNTKNSYDSAIQELGKQDYNIPVIREAVIPESPVSPRKMLNMAIAAVLGIFLSIFLVFMKKMFAEK